MFLLLSVQGIFNCGNASENYTSCIYSWCLPADAVLGCQLQAHDLALTEPTLSYSASRHTISVCCLVTAAEKQKPLCQRACLQCKNLLISLIPSALQKKLLKFQKSEYCKQGKAMPILGWKWTIFSHFYKERKELWNILDFALRSPGLNIFCYHVTCIVWGSLNSRSGENCCYFSFAISYTAHTSISPLDFKLKLCSMGITKLHHLFISGTLNFKTVSSAT